MHDWKTIIAIAALCAPLAWCAAEDSRHAQDARARMAEACMAAGGIWANSYGGYCEEPTP